MGILLLLLIAILFAVGLFGSFVPAVPGVGLIYAGILLYAFANRFTAISVPTLVVFGLVALLASGAHYLGSAWGAKKGGGGKRALWGAVVGAVFGVASIGPVGLFAGAFVGALVGALLEGHKPEKAMNVAALSVIGVIGGSLVQFCLAITLIIAFLLAILL